MVEVDKVNICLQRSTIFLYGQSQKVNICCEKHNVFYGQSRKSKYLPLEEAKSSLLHGQSRESKYLSQDKAQYFCRPYIFWTKPESKIFVSREKHNLFCADKAEKVTIFARRCNQIGVNPAVRLKITTPYFLTTLEAECACENG